MKKNTFFVLLILGMAAQSYSQNLNVTFAGQHTYPFQTCSNIWGYVDSLGNEYALVGASGGLSIVNVTNPTSPVEIAQMPLANPFSPQNSWREVETWGKYAYVTTEAGGGLQIIDLSKLPGTNLPVTY